MSSVIWNLLWFVVCPAYNLSWEIFHVYLKRICISPIYFLPLLPISTIYIIRQKLLILFSHLYSCEVFSFLILLVTERYVKIPYCGRQSSEKVSKIPIFVVHAWYNDCLALNMSGTMDIIDFSPVIRSYYTTEGKGVIQM